MRRLPALLAAAALTLAACGGSDADTSAHGGHDNPMPGMSGSTPAMGGMDMPSGDGRASTVRGYTLALHHQPMPGMAVPLTFTITKNGRPVNQFDREQTKLMHFYLVRDDLTGFQHLHPSMDASGTWSLTPGALTGGTYRIYTQFLPHDDASSGAVVLARPLTVAGTAAPRAALPAPAATTTIDGYTLTVAGRPRTGAETPLRITVTRDGKPVTDLQPYLDTYAHVTAIHRGDLAFAHLHPAETVHGDHGGPTLTVDASLPQSGDYRMFIQFQTAGQLHTAAITVSAT